MRQKSLFLLQNWNRDTRVLMGNSAVSSLPNFSLSSYQVFTWKVCHSSFPALLSFTWGFHISITLFIKTFPPVLFSGVILHMSDSCKWFSYPNGIEPFLSIVKLFIAEESLIQDANKALAHRLSSLQRRNIRRGRCEKTQFYLDGSSSQSFLFSSVASLLFSSANITCALAFIAFPPGAYDKTKLRLPRPLLLPSF